MARVRMSDVGRRDDDDDDQQGPTRGPETGATRAADTPPAAAPIAAPTPGAAAPAAEPTKTKVSFYSASDDADRARGAYLHTQIQTGHRSLSAFIDAAVMDKVAQLEERYHAGKPFPPVRPGGVAQGRPMGS